MRDVLQNSRTALAVWAGLVAATLVSWWLGIHEGSGAVDGASVATVFVIIIAFVKVRFVGRHFMGIRDAPLALRVGFDGYVVVICTALCVIYLATS